VGTSINTNLASLSVQRYLNSNQSAVTNAMTRLSTGLRINSAKDDAAGLIIGERMSAQIRGMNVASRNANDAVSLVQTAESSLASVTSALQRIRELSVQAANASNTDGDRATLNKEAQELISEVDRISNDTTFNGVKLLNGQFTSQSFQVGANSGQQLQIDKIVDSRSTALGASGVQLSGSAMGKAKTAAAGPAGANEILAAPTAPATAPTIRTSAGTSPAISWTAGASAKEVAAAINASAGSIGVTATASTTATLSALSVPGTVTLTLGTLPNAVSVSASVTNTADLTALADGINGQVPGVTATFANPPSKSELKLTAADGSDIKLAFAGATAGTLKVQGSSDTTPQTLTSGGTNATTVAGSINLSSSKGSMTLSGFGATVAADSTTALNTLNSLDISTSSGAVAALKVIDTSLDQVSAARGDLGAKQSRLEALVANVDVVGENLIAARSRLMDADFAKETAALSRAQILQQAGTAMLAQANALPQQVLQLLKG
jgi:flagellin